MTVETPAQATPHLLSVLPPQQRDQLIQSMRHRRYQRGAALFHEGDPGSSLHLISAGHIAIRVSTPMGDVATLTVLGAGGIFGEQALIAGEGVRTASAIALTQAETMSIERSQFAALRRTCPEVERFLSEALAQQVRRLTDHLVEALYVPAEMRVLRRLVMLCPLFETADGTIVITVTQDDLASIAGTTRPTVNAVLGAAKKAGVVSLSRGRIEVLKPEALFQKSR